MQTESRGGIGRRDFPSFREDGRRSKSRFIESLQWRFDSYYGTVTRVFWGLDPELAAAARAPSGAFCKAAREYVLAEDYSDFFSGSRSRLRYMFHSRLVNFRPGLAEYICGKGCDLERAAGAAARSSKLEQEDRLLFFAWAVLQAYYGIADDGSAPDGDGDGEAANGESVTADDRYYRTLAKAALDLMDILGDPGDLNRKQVNTIRNRLWTAKRQKGAYESPVLIWKLKNDGTRRRIFASLRLNAYARLLRTTGGAE
jgi:hypothetical protein